MRDQNRPPDPQIGVECDHWTACLRVLLREHPHITAVDDTDDLMACASCPWWRRRGDGSVTGGRR